MEHLYSIVPLDVEHLDELCDYIKKQYDDGVITCPLFMSKLVPEGDPLLNKAKLDCEKYALFKAKLDKMGVPSGILVQNTIGHGATLNEKNNLTKIRSLSTGKDAPYEMCPYDKDFQKFMTDQFEVVASYHPDAVMVDDDFRLMLRPGRGCGCDLHIARFNEIAKTNYTREEVWDILLNEKDEKVKEIYLETQRESLLQAAQAMRDGLDRVDPTIPGSFCCVGMASEYADEIAKILAGKGNPVIVRINNGRYTSLGPKQFSDIAYQCADVGRKLRNRGVDYILAETDTCPQNRYSTSASSLHAHLTSSILEGANGAKHWITRLHAFEPDSGKAYNKILSEHKCFYEEIIRVLPSLKWKGVRAPISNSIVYDFTRTDTYYWRKNAWLRNILEKFGIPTYISEKCGGATFLEGKLDVYYSDEELLDMLKGTLFLDSAGAKQIIDRGMGQYLGVEIREWSGDAISKEFDNWGRRFNPPARPKELILKGAKALSKMYNLKNGVEYVELFPAITYFENSLGGKIFVFSGEVDCAYSYSSGIFSFLNESRKAQIVQFLLETGHCPVYCKTDTDVYMKCGEMENGDDFLAMFNISFDILEEIDLYTQKEVKNVKMLTKKGEYVDVEFEKTQDGITIKTDLILLMPKVFILQY